MAASFDYIIGDYSLVAPYAIELPDASTVTSPIQHSLCSFFTVEVFFQDT